MVQTTVAAPSTLPSLHGIRRMPVLPKNSLDAISHFLREVRVWITTRPLTSWHLEMVFHFAALLLLINTTTELKTNTKNFLETVVCVQLWPPFSPSQHTSRSCALPSLLQPYPTPDWLWLHRWKQKSSHEGPQGAPYHCVHENFSVILWISQKDSVPFNPSFILMKLCWYLCLSFLN